MRPVKEKWDRHTRVYQLADGMYRAEICEGQNYLNRDTGKYDEVKLDLISERNWEFEYAVRRNSFAAYFNDATDPVNPTLAGVEIFNREGAARWINYKIYGAAPVSFQTSGNRIVYLDCWPGVTCEYIVTPEKLKFNAIFADRQAVREIELTYKSSERILDKREPDGSIAFIDLDTQEELWRIEAPFLIEKPGKQLPPRICRNVGYRTGFTRRVKGKDYSGVAFRFDDLAWLDSARYPVTLDPTTIIQPPGKDTYIYKNFATTNYGTQDTLMMANWKDTGTNTWYSSRIIVSFDVTSLPADISVQSAYFDLYWKQQQGSKGKTIYVTAYRMIQNEWVETQATWNEYKTGSAWSSPGASGIGEVTATNKTTSGFSESNADYSINKLVYWNIKNMFNDNRNAGLSYFGVMLSNYDFESVDTGSQWYHSKESTTLEYRPRLYITYTAVVTVNFKADATLVKRYTGNITANAVKKKVVNKSFNAGATLVKTNTVSLTADSTFKKNVPKTFNANAAFQTRPTVSVTANSTFLKINSQPFNINAIIKKAAITGSFFNDAHLIKTINSNFNADSVFIKYEQLNSFRTSAMLRGENTSILFDNIFLDMQVTKEYNFSLNVTRQATWEVSTTT